MSIKTRSMTMLFISGAAAIGIAAAPTAAAAIASNCNTGGPGTECVTPGNAQINDALPPDFAPQYPDFSLFGFGRHGGAHR